MASKKYRPEEAVAKLRHADVLVSQGQSVAVYSDANQPAIPIHPSR